MPTTPNKGYQVQVTSSNVGTWGAVLNDQMIAVVDNNMGGIVTKSLSSSNVTLDATESQMAIVRLTGALLANIQVTTSCVGFFFVENLTSGAFSVTVTNGVSGVVVPPGRSTLIADTTNGVRLASSAPFDVGTVVIFQQTSAPTGWTKITTNNDKALRIVSGAAGTGGSVAFSTAFVSQTPSGTIGGTALTVGQLPVHDHFAFNLDTASSQQDRILNTSTNRYPMFNRATSSQNAYTIGGSDTIPFAGITSPTGSSQTHSHTFTGNAINLAVQYVDVIAARYGV